MELPELIRESRRALPGMMNQKKVCELIRRRYPGVRLSQVTFSKIEHGRTWPSCLSMAAIADVLGIPGDDVMQALVAHLKRMETENE